MSVNIKDICVNDLKFWAIATAQDLIGKKRSKIQELELNLASAILEELSRQGEYPKQEEVNDE